MGAAPGPPHPRPDPLGAGAAAGMALLVVAMGVGTLYMMRATYMPLSIRSSSLVLAGMFAHAVPVFTGMSRARRRDRGNS